MKNTSCQLSGRWFKDPQCQHVSEYRGLIELSAYIYTVVGILGYRNIDQDCGNIGLSKYRLSEYRLDPPKFNNPNEHENVYRTGITV